MSLPRPSGHLAPKKVESTLHKLISGFFFLKEDFKIYKTLHNKYWLSRNFNKGAKKTQWGKHNVFSRWCQTAGQTHTKEGIQGNPSRWNVATAGERLPGMKPCWGEPG